MWVCSKSREFWPNGWFFLLFREIRNFLRLFAQKLIKKEKHASLFEKLQFLAKWIIFHGNEELFACFSWKLDRNAKTCEFVREVASFGQIDDFSWFSAKSGTFCNFLLKRWYKTKNMQVSSKSCKSWPNQWLFLLFDEMRHFLRLFSEKFIKTEKHASLFEKLSVLAKSMIFYAFSGNEALFASFCWKLDQNAKTCQFFEKCQILPKLMSFHGSSRNEALFATFLWKVHQNRKTFQFVRKVECFDQIDDFSCFFR